MRRKPPFFINTRNMERAYAFFAFHEENGTTFTKKDIETFTGYAKGTVGNHYRRVWKQWFLKEIEPGIFKCEGLHLYPKSYFMKSLTQKWNPPKIVHVPHPIVLPTGKTILYLFLVRIIFYVHCKKK